MGACVAVYDSSVPDGLGQQRAAGGGEQLERGWGWDFGAERALGHRPNLLNWALGGLCVVFASLGGQMGQVFIRKALVTWGTMALCREGSRWAPGERHCEALGLTTASPAVVWGSGTSGTTTASGVNLGQSVRKDALGDGGFLFWFVLVYWFCCAVMQGQAYEVVFLALG